MYDIKTVHSCVCLCVCVCVCVVTCICIKLLSVCMFPVGISYSATTLTCMVGRGRDGGWVGWVSE